MDPMEITVGVAKRQHMVVATWQAEAGGLSRDVLTDRVRRQGWGRYGWGVTGLPGLDSPLRRLAAAVLAYSRPTGASARVHERLAAARAEGPEALIDAIVTTALCAGQAVTGRSGAWLHGFAKQPRDSWLWVPNQSGLTAREGVKLRFGGCCPGSIVWLEGLPVFDAEACILETARTSLGTRAERVDELIWMMSRADGVRVATVDTVAERLLDVGSITGGELLAQAIAEARGQVSHSKTEQRARALAAEALAPLGLTPEPEPYEIFVHGRRVAEADIAVLDITLDLEIDGPHHRFPQQRAKDDDRDRQLRRGHWEVERFPVELVDDHPRVFVARVRAAAQARQEVLAHRGR